MSCLRTQHNVLGQGLNSDSEAIAITMRPQRLRKQHYESVLTYFFLNCKLAFSLNKVNNSTNLLPNITLGMEIRDDCGTVNTALEQCLNFVLGTLTNKEQICSSLQASDAVKPKKATLVGVVGPSYSTTTIQVNIKISYI